MGRKAQKRPSLITVARLLKTEQERTKGLWQRVVDFGLTDLRVLARGLDLESLELLEEFLLRADFGVRATLRLTDRVEQALRRGEALSQVQLTETLKEQISEILDPARRVELITAASGPTVYLIVGVNGAGKTTSVGKLGHLLAQGGRRVLVAAADTYRAGAVAQLESWASRIGGEFLRGQKGGDPAAVAFDALDAAEARGLDVVLIDTAGRLHSNKDLMQELTKIDRVIRKRLKGAPHETLLVLDATVGQNALRQLEGFSAAVDVSGIILSKLDSSSRGGIVVALQEEYGVPVKLVGTGESLADIEMFDAGAFLEGVFAER